MIIVSLVIKNHIIDIKVDKRNLIKDVLNVLNESMNLNIDTNEYIYIDRLNKYVDANHSFEDVKIFNGDKLIINHE